MFPRQVKERAMLKTFRRCEVRFVRETAPEPYGKTMSDPDAIARLTRPLLKDLPQEHVLALLLDVRNRLIGVHTVAVGGLTQAIVEPGAVFRDAIVIGAVSVALVHSHPSGDPAPSTDDLLLTRRIEEVGRVVGIPLLDHVVVAEGGSYSLAAHGLIGNAA
jgi:DNA repair protein RadC